MVIVKFIKTKRLFIRHTKIQNRIFIKTWYQKDWDKVTERNSSEIIEKKIGFTIQLASLHLDFIKRRPIHIVHVLLSHV